MTPALCPCGAPVNKAVDADLCPRCYYQREARDAQQSIRKARLTIQSLEDQQDAAAERWDWAMTKLRQLDEPDSWDAPAATETRA